MLESILQHAIKLKANMLEISQKSTFTCNQSTPYIYTRTEVEGALSKNTDKTSCKQSEANTHINNSFSSGVLR